MKARPRDPASAAIEAALLIDVLADPHDHDDASDRVWTRPMDAVSAREMHVGDRIVAGWGEGAWRTRLRASAQPAPDSEGRVGPSRHVAQWSLDAPANSIDSKPLEGRLRDWHSQARIAMAELLPNAIDAATRSELVHRVLAQPTAYVAHQDKALRRLLGAHKVLRWSARRVILSAVASLHLGRDIEPATSPSWILLARLARIPRSRLAPDSVSVVALRTEAAPLCRTAQMLSGDSRKIASDSP